MRYEYYDREKDFTKEPYDCLPQHNIYPLSEEGLNKYFNQRNFVLEMQRKNYSRNKLDNQFLENEIKPNPIKYSFREEKKIKNNLNEIKENNFDKRIKYKTNRKAFSISLKKPYFEPIIIGKTLKNKYLIKQNNKTKTFFGEKIKSKISSLPIIEYNKILGDRKIEFNQYNAYNTSSNFSSKYSNHKSYFMGEKYNPLNYMMDNSKNRTKRNEFGSLFIN